jgi:hypothetical protein
MPRFRIPEIYYEVFSEGASRAKLVRHLTDLRSGSRAFENWIGNAKHPPHLDGGRVLYLDAGARLCQSLWPPLRLSMRLLGTLHCDAQGLFHCTTACAQVNSQCPACVLRPRVPQLNWSGQPISESLALFNRLSRLDLHVPPCPALHDVDNGRRVGSRCGGARWDSVP